MYSILFNLFLVSCFVVDPGYTSFLIQGDNINMFLCVFQLIEKDLLTYLFINLYFIFSDENGNWKCLIRKPYETS